jgi:hypothetical protein
MQHIYNRLFCECGVYPLRGWVSRGVVPTHFPVLPGIALLRQ